MSFFSALELLHAIRDHYLKTGVMIAIARRWHTQVERLCARSRLNGEQRSATT